MVIEDNITGRGKIYHFASQDAVGAITFFFLPSPCFHQVGWSGI